MPIFHDAEVLSIAGPDAVAFAQAQFTCDAAALPVGRWQFGAWLDAQGRVRALFHLARPADDRLLLLLRGGRAASLAEALRRYVFRSRLSLDALPARRVGRGPALAPHAFAGDEEAFALGCGDYGMQVSAQAAGDDEGLRLAQIRAGWPWLPDPALDALLPAALALERLGAVAFDKGCYPGQEIVARLHYRGGHKWRLYRVALPRPAEAGAALWSDGREAGRLLDTVATADGAEALAVIGDAFREADVQTSDGIALRILCGYSQEREAQAGQAQRTADGL
jgi:hypothetical protein